MQEIFQRRKEFIRGEHDSEMKLSLTRFHFEVWTKKRCEHFPCQLAIHIDHYSLMDNNSNI